MFNMQCTRLPIIFLITFMTARSDMLLINVDTVFFIHAHNCHSRKKKIFVGAN